MTPTIIILILVLAVIFVIALAMVNLVEERRLKNVAKNDIASKNPDEIADIGISLFKHGLYEAALPYCRAVDEETLHKAFDRYEQRHSHETR
jgi:hypothetical protein